MSKFERFPAISKLKLRKKTNHKQSESTPRKNQTLNPLKAMETIFVKNNSINFQRKNTEITFTPYSVIKAKDLDFSGNHSRLRNIFGLDSGKVEKKKRLLSGSSSKGRDSPSLSHFQKVPSNPTQLYFSKGKGRYSSSPSQIIKRKNSSIKHGGKGRRDPDIMQPFLRNSREFFAKVFKSIASKTVAGMSMGRSKENQDSSIVEINVLGIQQTSLIGVFDGHGVDGGKISKFLSDNLKGALYSAIMRELECKSSDAVSFGFINFELICKNGILNQNHYHEMEKIFSQVNLESQLKELNYQVILTRLCCNLNAQLKSSDGFSTYLSGSTGVISFFFADQIITANVGDSRAVLLQRSGETGKLNLKELSVAPHILTSSFERNRIISSGGEVRQMRSRLILILVNDGKYAGPLRTYKPGTDYPGLMMTRSFGDDLAHKYGVICEPGIDSRPNEYRDNNRSQRTR